MFRSSLAAAVVSGLGILSLGIPVAHAAGPSGLIAHRAVYDLELKDASDRSGISGMVGRMVYEFEGSDCAGFTTNFRFVTKIDTGDSTRVSDQQTTTFEDLGKRLLRQDPLDHRPHSRVDPAIVEHVYRCDHARHMVLEQIQQEGQKFEFEVGHATARQIDDDGRLQHGLLLLVG